MLGRGLEMLPVKLEDPELLLRAKRIGEVHQELRVHQAEAEQVKKELRKAEAELELEREKLAHMLLTGAEQRSVKVEAWADFERDVFFVIRLDTREVVEERKLKPEERQGDFEDGFWQTELHELLVEQLAAEKRMPSEDGGAA